MLRCQNIFELSGTSTIPDTGNYVHVIGKKQYEYSNHLGNVLATTSDKLMAKDWNNDNTVDSYKAEILSATDYTPFGVAMDGRTFTADKARYGFNGKEKDDEWNVDGGSYNFGARMYDSRLGSFLSTDKFKNKNIIYSPFSFAGANPIIAIDINGDSIWVVNKTLISFDSDGRRVEDQYTIIYVQGKIYDATTNNPDESVAPAVAKGMNERLSRESFTNVAVSENKVVRSHYIVQGMFEPIYDPSKVPSTDHLITIVDDVTGKADPTLTDGDAGGVAILGGQSAFIEKSGNLNVMLELGMHELGHLMGMSVQEHHQPNDPANYMSYNWNRNHYSQLQIMIVANRARSGQLNQGHPTTRATADSINFLWHTSTNEEPYPMSVKKGDIIPTPVNNN